MKTTISSRDDYESYVLFRSYVQPRHWELEHIASDWYGSYVLVRFCIQPRHFFVDRIRGDNGAKLHDLFVLLDVRF